MPQTRSRLFDDFSRLMTDAAGLAEGYRRGEPRRRWRAASSSG